MTIFITSFHPLISRNILQTNLLSLLTARGHTVVILAPDFKKKYFEDQFGGERVFIRGIPSELTRRDLFFRKLALAVTPSRALYIKKRSEWYRDKKFFKFLFSLAPAYTIGRLKLGIGLVRLVDRATLGVRTFAPLFDEFAPDVVFAADAQNELDVRLLQEARKAGVKSVAMVRSWDNLTTKGIMRALPDRLVVHNELIKQEAMRLSFVPESRISVVGIPHYDRYAQGPVHAREEFFRVFGFDPKKKLVVVAPVGNRYIHENRTDKTALETLSELDINILVRIPPCDVVNYEGFKAQKAKVAFYESGVSAWKGGRKLNELSRADEESLIDTLHFCDAVVSHLSTMCIDAAYFGKPVVVLGTDFTLHPRWDIINYYFDYYEHVQPILRSGGVKIAHRPEELIALVKAYLERPSLDAEGRARIVREEVQFTDRRATERLAEILSA